MELSNTQRGFALGEFKDHSGAECSLQKSSAFGDFIWLGIDKPKLVIFENEKMGQYMETTIPKTWSIHSRMHLSREQVKALLPALQKFVDTGELE